MVQIEKDYIDCRTVDTCDKYCIPNSEIDFNPQDLKTYNRIQLQDGLYRITKDTK